MNFVPCVAWVKCGVAKTVPDKLQLSQEELKRLIDEAKADLNDTLVDEDETDGDEYEGEERDNSVVEETSSGNTAGMAVDDEDINSKYNLDNYDDDETENNPIFNIAGLTLYADNKDDPYITVPDEDDDQEEEQNFAIKENDNLLVVGHVESDCSILEVYVYNQEEDDLYVHHDIVLPAYPLSVEWLNFDPTEDAPGNYVAVGDMTPVVNIWDLDVVDILEPYCKLGKKTKKKKKANKADSMSGGHTDAVLDLSWNRHVRNFLASGSADNSICLWDLQKAKCVSQMNFHSDKVQSLKWHPVETQILMSGGCDHVVNLFDGRTPNEVVRHWSVDGEVERILWNHFDPNYAFCSTDSGSVHCLDIRVDKITYTIKAHNDAVTGMDLSSQYPGCLVTASTDRTIKVWDVSDQPKFIVSKKLKLGSIYVAKSNPDHPFTFALGGDNQSLNMKVMDLMDISECSKHFNKDLKTKSETQASITGASSSDFSMFNPQECKKEAADVDMETDLNNFQGLSLSSSMSNQSQSSSSSQTKKSKRKNKFKNKKKFV